MVMFFGSSKREKSMRGGRPPEPLIPVEVYPVFTDAFDYYSSRNQWQVRINVWGWLGRLVYWIMYRRWKKRGVTVEKDGEYHRHHRATPQSTCPCWLCLEAYDKAYVDVQEKLAMMDKEMHDNLSLSA